jgi:hypothetical protein
MDGQPGELILIWHGEAESPHLGHTLSGFDCQFHDRADSRRKPVCHLGKKPMPHGADTVRAVGPTPVSSHQSAPQRLIEHSSVRRRMLR